MVAKLKISKVIIAVLILLMSGLIIIHKKAVFYNGGHSMGDRQRVQHIHVTGEPRKNQAEEKIFKSENLIPPKEEIVISESLTEQKIVSKKPNYQEDDKNSNENSEVKKNKQHGNSPQLDVHPSIENNLNQAKNQIINSWTNKNGTINQRIYPSPDNNLNQAKNQRNNDVLQNSAHQDLMSQSGQGRHQDQISQSGQARAQNTELIYSRLPSEQEVARMDFTTLTAMYHKYVNTIQNTCRNLVRLGNIQDGGWDICDDLEYRPQFNSCLVFSFGINFDFSFDDAVTEKYGCEVHSYDPSMNTTDYKRSEKIWFHDTGLSANDGVQNEWQMKRFSTIRQELGKSRTPVDVLKIDIEMWELQAIPEMVKSGTLRDVKQFVVEIHLDLFKSRNIPSREKYIDAINCLRYLYDNGFRIIYSHKNPACLLRFYTGKEQRWSCHEISFARM